ncbi:colorectal mutant cancer protein isoform X2 [Trichomycterus rosablanca]|uniref:colorectal mutant cancer protein isoform X2 n=1 Tax=Trichomycterus rosablanca TaxID=2290929 RepID=UPI002F351DD2
MTEKNGSQACPDHELAKCDAEVSTLLQIISELSVKMGALQIPRDQKDFQGQGQTFMPVLELNSSPLAPQSNPDMHSGPACIQSINKQGGSEELWAKLQQLLNKLESSASRGRKLVRPGIPDVGKTQAEHIMAARDSWVQATQILVEMERELGITYQSELPAEERQMYQKDVLSLHELNQELKSSLQTHQEELKNTEKAVLEMDEEKKRLREKLSDLKSKWLKAASCSPPSSPSLSSSRTPSPCWASPTIPGSPMFIRRMSLTPPASPSRPPRPSSNSSVLETETQRLQRYLERLKARNERLTAALERRKSESEQISMTLSRHESDCSALQMALAYCEECEEAYSDLLSLCEARKHQTAALAEPSTTKQPDSLITAHDESSCTTVDTEVKENSLLAEEFEEKTGVIRQRIARLKQDRAAVCIPEEIRTGEGKLSPDTGTLAGARKHSSTSNNPRGEKAALLYELVNVREEMSELRGMISLVEKERRCLEFSLVAYKCQDSAGAVMAQSLREELEDRRTEQQRTDENRAKLESGVGAPGPRNHAIIRELHAALQREQKLKTRVTSLRESLDSALLDYTTQSRVNKDEVTRLALCHNKATSACRSARKKHHEQLWRLERQMMAMQERHAVQLAELKGTLEALEWKKEETVL